jgi:Lon protease-like protein
MFELPLFPLNTVLFPGMPITLHVFEDRYKQMVSRCLDREEPFGVTLIQKGVEAGGPAMPNQIGCTARITHTQPLEDGRMNLVAMGEQRFKIHSLDYDNSYLLGHVDALPELPVNGDVCADRCQFLRMLVTQYLTLLAEVSEVKMKSQLPLHPVEMAYLAATLLQVPSRQKQPWLEIDDAQPLLMALTDAYRREVPLLRTLLAHCPDPDQDPGSFSLS